MIVCFTSICRQRVLNGKAVSVHSLLAINCDIAINMQLIILQLIAILRIIITAMMRMDLPRQLAPN